jgi:hypothetical protein
MHLLPDLTPNTELALYCATILGLVLVIARGFLAWHRQRIAVRHQYPDTWSDADIRILEQIRIAIGNDMGVPAHCRTPDAEQRAFWDSAGPRVDIRPAAHRRMAWTRDAECMEDNHRRQDEIQARRWRCCDGVDHLARQHVVLHREVGFFNGGASGSHHRHIRLAGMIPADAKRVSRRAFSVGETSTATGATNMGC